MKIIRKFTYQSAFCTIYYYFYKKFHIPFSKYTFHDIREELRKGFPITHNHISNNFIIIKNECWCDKKISHCKICGQEIVHEIFNDCSNQI